MAYNKKEKVQVKIEFLRMMLRLQVDSAKESLILSFFDYYLELDEQEEEEVLEILRRSKLQEDVKIMEMIPYWERKGIEKGREQGIEEGKKSLLVRLLQKRFGSIPKEIEEAIEKTSYDRLEKMEDVLFDIQNIDEVKKWLN